LLEGNVLVQQKLLLYGHCISSIHFTICTIDKLLKTKKDPHVLMNYLHCIKKFSFK